MSPEFRETLKQSQQLLEQRERAQAVYEARLLANKRALARAERLLGRLKDLFRATPARCAPSGSAFRPARSARAAWPPLVGASNFAQARRNERAACSGLRVEKRLCSGHAWKRIVIPHAPGGHHAEVVARSHRQHRRTRTVVVAAARRARRRRPAARQRSLQDLVQRGGAAPLRPRRCAISTPSGTSTPRRCSRRR